MHNWKFERTRCAKRLKLAIVVTSFSVKSLSIPTTEELGRALKLPTGHATPRKRRLVEKEERGSRSSPRLKIPVESSSNWSSPGFHST
ncbi:unnamed protein product [Brassica rapa subsp. narinosa]